ncbi:MAG TPA: right-handed parallel beta-helix repeat-containing protein, partial [bacterium]|nr:right-handed parallel beta-helix repeat-containing protein [bacterium]
TGPAVVRVRPGVYSPSTTGETFPLRIPEGVTLESEEGPGSTAIDAGGSGPVILFDGVEGAAVAGFTIRGGNAERGGGIGVFNASAVIRNNVIEDNRASVDGAAIYVTGDGEVAIVNNLVNRSARSGESDVHGVLIEDASPFVVNNTVVNGDGNGILTRGSGLPSIQNNILAGNAGRGICHLADDARNATLAFNVFHGNAIAAVLIRGEDGGMNITGVEAGALSPDDAISDNLDADPLFVDDSDFSLRSDSPAFHAGNPDAGFSDPDGMRNTIGHTGGPFAPEL